MVNTRQSVLGVALAAGAGAAVGALPGDAAAQGWEPTKTVEFIVPAGTGGGADQMARMIQGVVQKHGLMEQPIVVINKSGGAGAEGFLDVTADQGNDHKIIITLSNLFTTPLATGVPFSWEDMTPVAMLALDEFILWVNAAEPYQTPQEYLEAAKAAGAGGFKMAGTGSKQEDQIVTVALAGGIGRRVHLRAVQGRRRRRGPVGRRARQLDREQSDRAGVPLASRRHAPALRVRQ